MAKNYLGIQHKILHLGRLWNFKVSIFLNLSYMLLLGSIQIIAGPLAVLSEIGL